MKRKSTTATAALAVSGMFLAVGVSGAVVAGELDVHYDRSAVPAAELTGPQVARPDHLREIEFAAFVKDEERFTRRVAVDEIQYDRSAAPLTEWVGSQVAWPDRLREAEFAAVEVEADPEIVRPQIAGLHDDRSAVPLMELTGPHIARPDRVL
jgi:hypothetical protein